MDAAKQGYGKEAAKGGTEGQIGCGKGKAFRSTDAAEGEQAAGSRTDGGVGNCRERELHRAGDT